MPNRLERTLSSEEEVEPGRQLYGARALPFARILHYVAQYVCNRMGYAQVNKRYDKRDEAPLLMIHTDYRQIEC